MGNVSTSAASGDRPPNYGIGARATLDDSRRGGSMPDVGTTSRQDLVRGSI